MARRAKKKSTEGGTSGAEVDPASENGEVKAGSEPQVEDAEVIEETPPDAATEPPSAETSSEDDVDATDADDVEAESETDGASSVDATPDAHDETIDTVVQPTEDSSESARHADENAGGDDSASAPPPAITPQPERRSAIGLVVPLLIGGLIAGLLGFFASQYMESTRVTEGPTPADNAARLDTQQAAMDSARSDLDALAAIDMDAAISEAIVPLRADLDQVTERIDVLTERFGELTERVETIAMRPTATGIEADEFDAALQDFRDQLNAAISSAQTEITEARNEAARISEEAFSAEQQAILQGAISQIGAALESGAPYAEPLASAAEISGETPPEALAAPAGEGVPTLAELQQSFPESARSALDAAVRSEDVDNPADRFSAFLRSQTGVRSLAPREGDSADAVLSRAEEALRNGNMQSVLNEIEALPDAARPALAEWEDRLRMRLDAVNAANSFAETLNTK